MPGRWTNGSLRLVVAIVLGALIPLALAVPALAQQAPPSAELKRVIGRVEILRKGQTQWIPAVIGARLVEGDDIRAFSGAQAELALPDTSTVQLAENSRLLMTKLEYDQQQQSRFVLLHLVVGKVRAAIAQTAITLVRARQSNFGISTPTAVAAARGTIVWVYTDGTRTLVAVEPEPGLRIQPRIECITVATTQQPKRQMVLAGYATTDCGPTVTATPQFMSLSNPATAGTPAAERAGVRARQHRAAGHQRRASRRRQGAGELQHVRRPLRLWPAVLLRGRRRRQSAEPESGPEPANRARAHCGPGELPGPDEAADRGLAS